MMGVNGFRKARRKTRLEAADAFKLQAQAMLRMATIYLTAFEHALSVFASPTSWAKREDDIIWIGEQNNPQEFALEILKKWRARKDGVEARATEHVREESSPELAGASVAGKESAEKNESGITESIER